jgi:hypothetical protein
MTRRTKLLLGGTAGLLGLVVLFLVEERIRGQLSLAAWKRAMAARGEPLEVAALDPAVHIRGARVLLPAQLPALLSLPGRTGSGEPVTPRQLPPGKEAVLWGPAGWAGHPNPTHACAVFSLSFAPIRERLPGLRAWLTNAPLVVQHDYAQGWNLEYPHLGPLKNLGQVLRLATLLALQEGDPDEALENLLASRALVDSLRHEGVLVSQLVRMALGQIALGTVWQAVQADGWTDAQLAALQTAWQDPAFLAGTVDALRLERAAYLEQHTRGRPTRSELRQALEFVPPFDRDSQDSPFAGPGSWVNWLGPLQQRGAAFRRFAFVELWHFAWSSQDARFHGRAVQAFADVAEAARSHREVGAFPADPGGPDAGTSALALPAKLADLNAYDRLRFWLAALSLSATATAVQKAYTVDGYAELARTAIALKRYHLRHGEWPPNLAALVPACAATPPRDWMDGQPLRYRRNADGGFTLYSVGADGRDDGGDARPPQGEGRSILRGRDWVWPQQATDAELRAAQSAGSGPGSP